MHHLMHYNIPTTYLANHVRPKFIQTDHKVFIYSQWIPETHSCMNMLVAHTCLPVMVRCCSSKSCTHSILVITNNKIL